MTKRSIRPSTRKVPRPIIALAAPSSDQPTTTIKMLKGGEINGEIKAPGSTVEKSVQRAVAAFETLIRETHRLELLAGELRRERAAAGLVKPTSEESGK